MKRRISAVTLVFLIIFSAMFPVKAATNEGYGEDQTSLGRARARVATVDEEIDWLRFWQMFKQYAQWNLEWYNGDSWVNVKEDLDVELSFPQPNERKVNLVFDASHSGNYRLTFAIDRMVKDYVTRVDVWQYELTYNNMVIIFDWSDCKDVSGLKFSHGVKDDYFWFRIRRDNVPLGAHVEIDPSTVATTTTVFAVSFPYQRKSFYAAGLFWATYSNGTHALYESTTDPEDWSGNATSIGRCDFGFEFGVWFDGTYVHYVRRQSHDLTYRRGKPESDGTITWSAVEQLVYDGISTDRYLFPSISVDSDGYAWIGSSYYNGSDYTPYVLKNSENDGTWATDFATQLSVIVDSTWRVTAIPLMSGKVYVIYCRDGQAPLGNLYDAGWDGEENTLADHFIEEGYHFSAVADGNDVHFVYNRDSMNQIRHNIRTFGVGWAANDVLVHDPVTRFCGPALSIDTSIGDLYCFWTNRDINHVYYKKYSSGAWGDLVDWIDETTDGIHRDYLHSSFYQSYGEYIGLLYVTKLGSPYNVRFAFLTLRTLAHPTLLFGAGFNSSSPYVELHWNHSLVDVQFFEVQNSTDGISWSYLGQSNTANYTDTQVINGTERYYRVRANNQTWGVWVNSSWTDVNFETVYFIPRSRSQNVPGEWIYYNLTAINTTFGIHDSGFVNSTYFIDGDTWNCSEVVGVPGYVVNFNVTGIDENAISLWFVSYVYYDGSASHEVNVEIWNFTSNAWVEIGEIPDMLGFEWMNYSIYGLRIPNNFVNSTGALVGRLYHADAGNINHDIYFDRINILAFVPSEAAPTTTEEFQFFWIVLAIALMLIGILISKMWFEEGDP